MLVLQCDVAFSAVQTTVKYLYILSIGL